MKSIEKELGALVLHLDREERELIYNALRHYSVYSDSKSSMLTVVPKICEMMNVLYISEV